MSTLSSIIYECVDKALSSVDFVDKQVFYQYLEQNYGVTPVNFAEKFSDVHEALRSIYGINHYRIERLIVRTLNERLRKGLYPRHDEVAAFNLIVTTFMERSEISRSRRTIASVTSYARNLEAQVKETREQLEVSQRMAAIGQTAAMVGHDIRNPLQSIVGELYLQRDDVESLPEGENKKSLLESIRNIEENIFYINKIVADLQDFAKPIRAEEEEVDINEIIADIFSISPIPNYLQVEIYVDNNFPIFMASKQMLKRALANLVINAVQAMPKEGTLTVTARCLGSEVEIAVQDTGDGIPEDVKPKLFNPLVTTKAKGQGLGLAVVKRLTEAQGGSVGFESEEGRGAKFYIRLPILPIKPKQKTVE